MHARFWIVCTYISLQNLRELWCGMWYVLTWCAMLAVVFWWPFSVLCSHPRTHIHTIIESVHKSHKTMNEMNNFVESTQTHEHPKWRMCGICSVCYYFDVWRCIHAQRIFAHALMLLLKCVLAGEVLNHQVALHCTLTTAQRARATIKLSQKFQCS